MSMISAPANAMSSTFSAGSSVKIHVENKNGSKFEIFDPNSKSSVLKYMESNLSWYHKASKKIQMNKEVIHAACDIDNYVFTSMEGKAKIIAMKYISQLPPTKYEIYE